MSTVLKILAIFLIVIIVALLGFKLFDYIRAFEYYNNSKVMFATPGVTDSNFVPQGMTYDAESKVFYFTGYMSDDTAARVYFSKDGGYDYAELLNADGSAYTDHTGGIEIFDKYVYITGEDSHGLDVFLLEDVLKGSAGEGAKMQGTVKTYNSPAHVYAYEFEGQKYIMAGSYHKDETVYLTPDHEQIKTPSGDQNYSVMTVLKLDAEKPYGIDPDPVAIISAREMIQGICITPDRQMVVSTSWGLSPSQLFFYDLDKVQCIEEYNYKSADGEFDFTVPCYFVDDSCLVRQVQAAPMSEELVCLQDENGNDRIIVFCESACNKYIFGKLTTGFKTFGYKYEKIR